MDATAIPLLCTGCCLLGDRRRLRRLCVGSLGVLRGRRVARAGRRGSGDGGRRRVRDAPLGRAGGPQVAELTRARAGDEWRFEERVAELETDLEESRELRAKLEQRLRAKRAELAGLRNEHAALLRRYATAETERASALEGRGCWNSKRRHRSRGPRGRRPRPCRPPAAASPPGPPRPPRWRPRCSLPRAPGCTGGP
ncbi:hypothetical protein ACFQ3Z_26070 [Streptomyces nogalater]